VIRVSKVLSLQLEKAIRAAQAAGDLPEFEVLPPPIEQPKPELGDYATPVAMKLAEHARMPPPKIAGAIAAHFDPPEMISEVTTTGGYINFRLNPIWLQQQVEVILSEDNPLAQMTDHEGQKAQVECVSANPTGPITVGRIRGGVIGDTLARLLRAMGYDVEMEYYFNNAGAQMRKLGQSLRARYLERLGLQSADDFPTDGYQGDYLYEIADMLITEKGDSLVNSDDESPFKDFAEEHISGMQRESLARLGIRFDTYFNENSLYDSGAVWSTLNRLKEKGLVYAAVSPETDEDYDERPDEEDLEAASTGEATWIRMRQLRGTKKDKVLVKSTGEPAYRMPDIAYHLNKLDRGFDLAVNILGADHIEEAKDVKAAVAALGYDAERIQPIIHQFVTLMDSDTGEVKKQSTRRGEFVTLDDLVDDVGTDATRYFILERSPNSELVFDLELARKQSSENPVYYIQNAHVRCVSIQREAADRGIEYLDGDVSLLVEDRELQLIKKLIELPEAIEFAVERLEPHLFAKWTYEELARTFHPVYEEIRAMHGDVGPELSRARLKLYSAARLVLARALELLGMSAPERM